MNTNPIMAEDEAEKFYVDFKKSIEEADPEIEELMWKKVYWYLSWRIPPRIRDEVDKYAPHTKARYQCEVCRPKFYSAHQHRPGWIRKQPGGDDYDNGKVSERHWVPL